VSTASGFGLDTGAAPAPPVSQGTRRTIRVPAAARAVGAFVVSGVFGLIVGIVLLFLASIPLGYRSLTAMSGSMEPTLHVGDVVIERSLAPVDARIGDIVTFRDPNGAAKLVTHRIRSVRVHDGVVDIVTKGDANNSVERWSIPEDGRLGVVSIRVPKAGFAFAWASGRTGRIVLIAIPAMLLGILELIRIWRPRRTAGR